MGLAGHLSAQPGIDGRNLREAGARTLLLYDGLCGLCNGMVRRVLRRNHDGSILFAAQQSPVADEVLARHGVSREAMLSSNSVYLVLGFETAGECLLTRSDVPVNVMLRLSQPWRFLGSLLGTIPKPLRDAGYTLVARNRFRFTERFESCPIPTPDERARFLG